MVTNALRHMILILLPFAGLSIVAGEDYKIDNVHSTVLFAAQHNGAGWFYGRFNEYEGTATFDGGELAAIEANINTSSVDTANADRDKHLRSPDFFNAKQFPTATFKSTAVEKDGEGYKVTGELTVLGKTETVTFNFTKTGEGKNRQGKTIIGLHGKGHIDRAKFGMTYGQGALSDKVKMIISLEVVES